MIRKFSGESGQEGQFFLAKVTIIKFCQAITIIITFILYLEMHLTLF